MRRLERHLVPFMPRIHHHHSRSQIHPIVQRTFQRGKAHKCKGEFTPNPQSGFSPTCADANDPTLSSYLPKPTAQGPPRSRSFLSSLRSPTDPTVLPPPAPNPDRPITQPEPHQSHPAPANVSATELQPLPHKFKQRRRKLSHLTMEDIDRIRELRFHEDPRLRKDCIELARMFGVTPLYVRLIAPLPEHKHPV